jgi:polysaccharide export outer membrane protein
MVGLSPNRWSKIGLAWLGFCTLLAGCQTCGIDAEPIGSNVPRELKKVSLPPYVIEPPDTLQIDAVNVVPKPPYRIGSLDLLNIETEGTLPNQDIKGTYQVEPDGRVRLGRRYGQVNLAGLTLDEAGEAIDKYLKRVLRAPKTTVTLAQSRALQLVRGEHLVTPDGTISFGTYGHVNVAGLTIPQAKDAIETYLSQYILRPDLSVIVSGYNTKVFYVIFDGGLNGHTMARLPITGNETVLDAIAEAGGMPTQASLSHVWVARPNPGDPGCDQILPVHMLDIMRRGCTTTNYQLLPGDRVYVKANPLIAFNNGLNNLLSPIDRIFGEILLGISTVETVRNPTSFFGGFGGF